MVEQRSSEWYRERLGNATASRVNDIIATTRNGYTAKREAYMVELLAERLTGITQEHFVNEAMQWGIEQEDFAAAAYEAKYGVMLQESGYVPHPSIERTGASPDRLIGMDGLVEIKCPLTKTHLETILIGAIPEQYKPQMTWQLECTNRVWCDFVSFDPRLPENARIFVRRFVPEPAYRDFVRAEIVKFLEELAELERVVREYKGE